MSLNELSENIILKDERLLLIQAFKASVKDIQSMHNIDIRTKTNIIDVLEERLQEVIDRYPKLRELI